MMMILAGLSIPGGWELIVILLIVLILFGPKNLPKIGGAIGRSIREFKDGISSLGSDDKDDDDAAAKKPVQPMKRDRAEALPGAGEQSATSAASAESEPAKKND